MTEYHYGFYAAMKVEYDLAKAPVTYEQEKELGEKPVRLDFLIIKKQPDTVLHDPIGEFFRPVNIFEYKSPEDGLTIDDFYKAQGYGLIYKSLDRKVNELPIEDMTLTLVRHSYPREMIKSLKNAGFTVLERYPGIYRIDGKISIPVQLVVSSRLPIGSYDGLKLLAKGVNEEDIIKYAEKAVASDDENIKDNAGTVIGICFDINKNLKEAKDMNDVVKHVFKKDIDKAWQDGANSVQKRVAADMLKENLSISKISKLSEATIRSIASSLNIAVI